MALRGFSKFEAMFRQKMAKSTPIDVLHARKKKDGFTKEEIKEYRTIFNKFDTDKGGSIDSEELGNLVRVLGLNPTDDEIKQLTEEIDEDGSGEIEFDEFLQIMESQILRSMQKVDAREARLREAFQIIETRDGRLRKDDIFKLLTTKGTMMMTNDEVLDLMDKVASDRKFIVNPIIIIN